jgi:hypothetical protein
MVNKPLTHCPFKGNQLEFVGAPIFVKFFLNIKVARLVCTVKLHIFYSFANVRGDTVQSPSVYGTHCNKRDLLLTSILSMS